MPVLHANKTVHLGSFNKGATLIINQPLSGSRYNSPKLNGADVSLSDAPRRLPLVRQMPYTLSAGASDIIYQVETN